MNTLRLRFLGGIETVTGSCTLMEYNKTHYYLIDAGLYQNEHNLEFNNIRERILKKYAKKIDIIFITHSHLDHIGLLPKIFNWGFRGKIYGTKATFELAKIMLEDSLKINRIDNQDINFSSRFFEFYKKYFIEFDKNEGEKYFEGFGKKHIKIEKDFSVTILRSSHILGSCTWQFRWTENIYEDNTPNNEKEWKYLYFTGDIGPVRGNNNANILFKEHQIPFENENKSIVMESTYGGIVREKLENLYNEKIAKLADLIISNIEKNRFVIIPAFALDRAQQILVDLFFIRKKYKINGNFWYQQINCDNLFVDKNKRDIINLVINNKVKDDTSKKKFLDELNKIFNNDNILFQDIPEEKQKFIKDYLISIKIGIKSTLINNLNKVYFNHLTDDVYSEKEQKRKYKYLSDEFLKRFEIDDEINSDQKEKINKILKDCFINLTEEGNIIVSASGMCDEGSVIELLQSHLKDENTTIILTGYQANGTNGYLLKNLIYGKYDENNLKDKISLKNIDIKLSDIKCKIEDLSAYYSGHADQEQLINYIFEPNKESSKTTVILNHGSEDARTKLSEAINKKEIENTSVLLPEFNRWFDIGSEKYELTEAVENNEVINLETIQQVKNINIDGIQMYFPVEYNEDKLTKIIDYIKSL